MKKNKAKDTINYVLNESKIIIEIKDSKIEKLEISDLILEEDIEKKVLKEIIKLIKKDKIDNKTEIVLESKTEETKTEDINSDKNEDFFEITSPSKDLKEGDIIKTKKGTNEIISIEEINTKPIVSEKEFYENSEKISDLPVNAKEDNDFFDDVKTNKKIENISIQPTVVEDDNDFFGVENKTEKIETTSNTTLEQPSVVEDEDFW
jgi:hypothetical protein